ncbi:GTP cyclohydrolase I [Coriobacterium glomerans PW2]|uniref:GTP cyclohydrolase 1 n=1 Tax=Coriobacterium glomerans (strain ATCC 49209 / DSM 20642 / JCM 10262 / PW2) TaxID=700015 RepID=F2N7H8_CORGP|nr:GTP cyclohydrolase I FolE [Coriobacterium glomerans]AEB06794.1 GTP cyclohydrolase I [Coriobacterium glomerans PW2]
MIDQKKIEQAVELLLEGIGEDPGRAGLIETPARVARMYAELCAGKLDDASKHLARTFSVSGNDLVIERDIMFHSLCEHHLLPFFGHVHIGYVPCGRVVGLSKLARLVEVFARRLQLQERMTAQIADALMEQLAPQGVIVMIEAEHLCMAMRGVAKPGTWTTTLAVRGIIEQDPEIEQRFFRMLGRP